jgi:hypothetical protein
MGATTQKTTTYTSVTVDKYKQKTTLIEKKKFNMEGLNDTIHDRNGYSFIFQHDLTILHSVPVPSANIL